jgi:spore maturation protein CgeB
VDCHDAHHRATANLDDVVLVLRGRDAPTRLPGQVLLLWIISHPELVDDAELVAADAVFAASLSWSRTTSERTGRLVTPLLQATDPSVFHPDAEAPSRQEGILFVGNTRGVYRPVVRDLVESGVDVVLYGRGWERFVDRRLIRADSVPNDRLAGHYGAAGVVLNDHWHHMRESGFMSNRLFDAAASGARVVSDDVEGAEELFAGLVRTFRTKGELLELVTRARELFPDAESRASLAHSIGREHSFDARAATLLAAAADARGRAQSDLGAVAAGTK